MDFFRRNCLIFSTVLLFLARYAVGEYYETQQPSEGVSVAAVSQRLNDHGEGPHWDVNTQMLYHVDSFVGEVCRLDPKTGVTETVPVDGVATTMVIPYQSEPSKLLVTVNRQVQKVDFKTGQSEVLAEIPPGPKSLRFNDGKCDAYGRAWTGDLVLEEEGKAHLYRIDPGYTLTPVSDNFTLTNGITWSLDYSKMYLVDSTPRLIYSFDYNLEDGTASNKQILINQNNSRVYDNLGIPDGMTIDEDGKLWVAQYGGGCVLRIDPVTKSVLTKIDIPATNVTSCAFGGPQFDILYVTTGKSVEEAREPLSGAVFAITGLGTKGLPPNDFVDSS